MHRLLIFALVFTLSYSCSENNPNDATISIKDHSYSNINEIKTIHLHLDFDINFEERVISGIARHTMENSGATEAIFDIYGLSIDKVTLGQQGEEIETSFSIGVNKDVIGAPLSVKINEQTTHINIYYKTTEQSAALDWLAAELTMSKKFPFLYTQGQAILTRTWIPTQDTPANRITYSADVKVPAGMMAVMSATNPTSVSEDGQYHFVMNQAIPCYLIALAVGDISFAPLGRNTGVYAEPGLIDEAVYEFDDLQKMVDAAEELYGQYLWERYDVIVLPYSFPFGGMENPRLTFANPTLITGDRSLVSVIAHELAHSWSGNLVTNATWNDFWLNEGFTVYFENRIMEKLYGKEVANMLALIEFQELEQTTKSFMNAGKAHDTHLKLNLDQRDPDDGMTDIAYVKGAFFLKTLEETAGRDKFDTFLRSYFNTYKFQTLTTEDFVAYLTENLLDKHGISFNIDEWIYQPGIPDNCVVIHSNRFAAIQNLAREIKQNGGSIPDTLHREQRITQEWLAFIREFGDELNPETMREIDAQLNLKGSGNAEIMTEWFILGIHSGYLDIRPEMEKFLMKVGRRKFIKPLYLALSQTEENLNWAKNIYSNARQNYHTVSVNTIDHILGYSKN
jgi:leukotriene-A4 hydrolase